MAEQDETTLSHSGSPEMGSHVQDYERFTKLFKWGAIICLVIGLLSLIIIKAYW